MLSTPKEHGRRYAKSLGQHLDLTHIQLAFAAGDFQKGTTLAEGRRGGGIRLIAVNTPQDSIMMEGSLHRLDHTLIFVVWANPEPVDRITVNQSQRTIRIRNTH